MIPYLYLAGQIAFAVAFAQVLRFGQKREASTFVVVWINYASAALLALAWWWLEREGPMNWTAAALGALTGVLYFTNILWMLAAYRFAGVGVTTSIMVSSTVLPVVVAWLAWGDSMSVYRWIALGLVWAAIGLMRPSHDGGRKLTWKADAILLLAFLNTGLIGVIHKAGMVYAPGQQYTYQMALFVFAAGTSMAYSLPRREPHTRAAIGTGLALGVVNVLATLFVLFALSVLEASVVFPTGTACVISLNVLLARVLWGERLARRQLAGIALAIFIVVLVNLEPAAVSPHQTARWQSGRLWLDVRRVRGGQLRALHGTK